MFMIVLNRFMIGNMRAFFSCTKITQRNQSQQKQYNNNFTIILLSTRTIAEK